VKDAIERLVAARAATLAFVTELDEEALRAQPSPSFSPIGWHLGHIAFTEAHWILARCGGDASLSAPYAQSWAQDGRPKHERVEQPPRGELLAYLAEVRARVIDRLSALDVTSDDPLLRDGFVAWLVEAHEHQHRETMAIVRQLALERGLPEPPEPATHPFETERVPIEGGLVELGTDERLAYDNERPAHTVHVHPFELDRTPACVAAWEDFRAGGGYTRAEHWSPDGWAWRERNDVCAPQGWTRDPNGRLARIRLSGGLTPLDPNEAVTGISFYEAEAFANFGGARLPTEAEWELAARVLATAEPRVGLSAGPAPVRAPDLIGNVWEWTSTPFAAYPGFAAFPYRGYSEPYFDGVHRVLRGGSFATDPRIARVTFRNWYEPWRREIFAGVRCAR
jgi:gamma-glutamyl hercynylcysteine S-oxide synthase